MSYYQGDYYRGDYYRGDPGFFSALAGLGKKLLGGGLARTPVGGLIATGTSIIRGGPPPIAIAAQADIATAPPGTIRGPIIPTPGVTGFFQRLIPGGKAGFEGAPPGYHINKAYLRWAHATQMGHHVKRPYVVNIVVRNRHMNALNAHALRRATHRERSALHLMKRILRGSGFTFKRTGFGRTKGGPRRKR